MANPEHESFIRSYARSRGVNEDLAANIARAEGLNAWSSSNPNAASTVDRDAAGRPFSFGDFQLNTSGGLGALALAHGIDPRDPNQWQLADKFAIDYMAQHGVAPWRTDKAVQSYTAQGGSLNTPLGAGGPSGNFGGGGGSGGGPYAQGWSGGPSSTPAAAAPAAPAAPAPAAPAAAPASNTPGYVGNYNPAPNSGGAVAAARQYLAATSDHKGRPGDTDYLHPEFATRLASAIQDARSQGLNVWLQSGYRAPSQLQSQGHVGPATAFDLSGKSMHTYGLAADINGLGKANSPQAQRWYQIATSHGLYNPYGAGNSSEFNHYQLLPDKVAPPQQLQALRTAYANGDWNAIWNAGSPTGSATAPATQVAQTPGQPAAAPVAGAPGAQLTAATVPVSPYSNMLANIGWSLSQFGASGGGEGGHITDPPDQPAIRSPALYEQAEPQLNELGGSTGSMLGRIGSLAPALSEDTNITQGAPTMAGLSESAGYAAPATGVGMLPSTAMYPTSRFSRIG